LKKIFSHYLPSILTFDEKSNDKKKVVNQWLKDNYANFVSYLLTLFENDEPAIQVNFNYLYIFKNKISYIKEIINF